MIPAEQTSIEETLHDRRMATVKTGHEARTGVPPSPFIIAGGSS